MRGDSFLKTSTSSLRGATTPNALTLSSRHAPLSPPGHSTIRRRHYKRAFHPVVVYASKSSAHNLPRLLTCRYLADAMTVPASLANLPALSVPVGVECSGPSPPLPQALQVISPSLREDRCLLVASILERRANFGAMVPPYVSGGVSAA